MGPGVKIRCKITLGHPQKLAKRREKVDSGTFPDLNHFLRRVNPYVPIGPISDILS